MTALSFGGAPGVAVLGGDLNQLRRRGGRWRLRDWRLRTKLTAVLLVPLVLAGVLGASRVAVAIDEARDLDTVTEQLSFARQLGLTVHELQGERYLTVAQAVAPDQAEPTALAAQLERVDRAVGGLRSARVERVDPVTAAAHQTALDWVAGLPELRQTTTAQAGLATARTTVTAEYSELIGTLLDAQRTMFGHPGETLGELGAGLAPVGVAKEQVSRQHAVLLAAAATGTMSDQQQGRLRRAEARFDVAVEEFAEVVPPGQWQLYSSTVTGAAGDDRERLLSVALGSAVADEPVTIDPAQWNAAASGTADQLRQVETELLDQVQASAADLSEQAWQSSFRDAAAVAALMVLAVLLLVVVLRSLLGPLRSLRTTAFDIADRRLPEVVEKLRVTDGKIGETVVDPVPVYSREEIGQVARAFDTVHVQAVRLAAEQAMLRNTVNDLFLNLAGRSQRLVERQLKLIDKLESGEQDPEQLDNLFQLDHLATRMRRNSENLVVLAGGELRRGAQRWVTVLDMLRAAVSEIAEYRRVTMRRPPEATVAGPVAGDLVHLVAELLDNAATAAPPDTPVTLTSSLTEDGGLLIEIVDCGTGLPPGELHAINERLASPPMVDASVSHQMGLFVVSRLAGRHRVRVRLRQKRGEFGIIASVLVPAELISAQAPVPADFLEQRSGGATSSALEWSGESTEAELPMQVSVVEGPVDGDLFSPSSIGNLAIPQRQRQRSVEEEWHELFSAAPPEPSETPGSSGSSGADADPAVDADQPVPSATQSPPLTPPGGVPVDPHGPATPADDEVPAKIFAEVSAWFREQRAEAPVPVPAATDGVPEWQSSADAGWYAANALHTPVDSGVTAAGLPRRQPRAHLVPGTAGPARLSSVPSWNGRIRTPEDVRGRLSNYQRGLLHGRHAPAGPDDESPPAPAQPVRRGHHRANQD